MYKTFAAALLASSALIGAPAALAQDQPQPAGAADLCKELIAYAEKKAAEPPKAGPGQAAAPAPAQPPAQQQAATPQPRSDGPATGTQGGGSQGPSTSSNVASQQGSAPPTAPVATGAAPEAASSPHATGSGTAATQAPEGPSPDTKLAGGTTLGELRAVAEKADRQACRDTAQKLRRAGADMPAPLLALAAYEPDPAKRQ